jgi:hypothetical protein
LKSELVWGVFIVLMGVLDWMTTILGVFYFGATEANPLIAGVAQKSVPVFSVIKLSAVLIVGFLFYNAKKRLKNTSTTLVARSFLSSGYLLSLMALTIVVSNNVICLAQMT